MQNCIHGPNFMDRNRKQISSSMSNKVKYSIYRDNWRSGFTGDVLRNDVLRMHACPTNCLCTARGANIYCSKDTDFKMIRSHKVLYRNMQLLVSVHQIVSIKITSLFQTEVKMQFHYHSETFSDLF